ncbi:MAG: alpha/beta fold hydrolase [Dehalococcoidia bacterium]
MPDLLLVPPRHREHMDAHREPHRPSSQVWNMHIRRPSQHTHRAAERAVRIGWVLVATVLMVSLAACSGQVPAAGPSETATPSQEVVAALVAPPIGIVLDAPTTADQGYPVTITGYLRRLELPVAANVLLDLGDGTSRRISVGGAGTFSVQHTYGRPGPYQVAAVATSDGLSPNAVEQSIVVNPRRIVFIQGVNSSSRCPDGAGFLTKAPQWLEAGLVADLADRAIFLSPDQFSYFSYSGRYCELAGSAPDYEASDTCASLSEVQSARLMTLVKAIGPGKVTLVGYSMGGLLAAYTVAANPEWAQERIASIITFDSPLGGIGLRRTTVLGVEGLFDSDCGPRTSAVGEMGEGSGTVRVASRASTIVPVYSVDATSTESGTFGRAEAVPGSAATLPGAAAHLEVSQRHSAIWNDPGAAVTAKVRFVVCAVLVDQRCT